MRKNKGSNNSKQKVTETMNNDHGEQRFESIENDNSARGWEERLPFSKSSRLCIASKE